jgi:hypothetical protein
MNEQDDASSQEGKGWLDRPANVSRIYYALIALCALLAVLGFFVEAHGELAIQHFPVFYGLFGFIAFIFIVFAGKALRKLVMRDEDYYDR